VTETAKNIKSFEIGVGDSLVMIVRALFHMADATKKAPVA
jgi:hypothetical protein